MTAESHRADSVLAFIPLGVLAAVVGGFFAAITRLVPSLVVVEPDMPRLAHILPFVVGQPYAASLALLALGGIVHIVGPRSRPLTLTAWYLGGAFIIALWITLLLMIPRTCWYSSAPLP